MLETYEWERDSMPLPLTWISFDCACMPHFHAGIELVYVRDGTLTGLLNGQAVTVQPGQMLISGCYAVHTYDSSPVIALVSVIPLAAVAALRKKLTSARFTQTVICDDESESLYRLLKLMETLPDTETIQYGLSQALIGCLLNRVPMEQSSGADGQNLICRILMYINEHFLEPLTVESLAETFGYSRSRFSHLFKAHMNYSLPQYLNALRIKSATQLLTETDMTVSDIALESGFNNAHTFYTAFRSVYGMAPGEYLKTLNSEKETTKT